MANKVNITDTKNTVTITPQSNTNVDITSPNTPITVTQGTTSVVNVNTPGPQGPQGTPGTSPGSDADIIVRHITASGNISASGYISASTFIGDGSGLTNIATGEGFPFTGDAVIDGTLSVGGNGNITASNNLKVEGFTTLEGNTSVDANLTVGTGYRFKFTNENVGLYRESNNLRLAGFNSIQFLGEATNMLGQAERMRIDSTTGNVGINTTSPSAKLDISGNINVSTTENVQNIIRSDGGFRFISALGSSNEDVQYLESLGDSKTLQWRTNGDAIFQIKSQNSGLDQAYINFNHVSGNPSNFSIGTSQDDNSFIISKASDLSSNKFFVITGSNGFVGINEPNPAHQLTVGGVIKAADRLEATYIRSITSQESYFAGSISFKAGAQSYRAAGIYRSLSTNADADISANDLIIHTDNVRNKFIFKNSGPLIISGSGNTALDVRGDVTGKTFFTDYGLFLRNSSLNDLAIYNETDDTGYIRFLTKRGNTQKERMRIANNGNVNIGNNTDNANLTVYGSVTANGLSTSGDLTADTLTLTGVSLIDNNTAVISGSNIFGSDISNSHQFTGSVDITGSLTVTQSITTDILVVDSEIQSKGDTDTKVVFGPAPYTDEMILYAGGVKMLTLDEGTNTSVIVNDGGEDVNFRVESDNDQNAFFVEGETGNVGIGTNDPKTKFEVIGDSQIAGNLTISGSNSEIILISESAQNTNCKIYNDNDSLVLSAGLGSGKAVNIGPNNLKILAQSNASEINGYFKFKSPPNDTREQVRIQRRTDATYPGLLITGSVLIPTAPDLKTINHIEVGSHITASGNISASGDIFANTASLSQIILDHKGTNEPTIHFKSDGGPNFTLGFNTDGGDNIFQLKGDTGASDQTFELGSKVETFRMVSGGTIIIKGGNNAGTGSKHDGGLFIEPQNSNSSNGKATQFTALSTGGILKNTSFGGTGKHGTFKFINGGNLDNAVDSEEHVVAEFGPTSSAHFTFHVPIIASGDISASGNIILDGTADIKTGGATDDIRIIPDNFLELGTVSTDQIFIGRDDDWVGNIKLQSGNGVTMTITGSKVGIGTTSPAKTLTVEGDISASGDIIANNFSGSGIFISGSNGITLHTTHKGSSGSIKLYDHDSTSSIELAVKNIEGTSTELAGIFARRGNGDEQGYAGWSTPGPGSQQFYFNARSNAFLQVAGTTKLQLSEDFALFNNITKGLEIRSNITASGNISSSGTVESDGLILSSPNGTRYKIVVDNDGNLSTTSA